MKTYDVENDFPDRLQLLSEEVAREKLRQWNGESWEGPLTKTRLWDAMRTK